MLRRVLDLRAALKLGIRVGLDEIAADEFMALAIIDDERDMIEREQADKHGR